MKLWIIVWPIALLLAGCVATEPKVQEKLPPVDEASAVLKNFRGEYSYGGVGLAPQSNDGELALWTIYHSPDAASRLVELYPECQTTGKAYVLAGLYHLDRKGFRKLTNSFCSEAGDIIVGWGCIQTSRSRSQLVADMQQSGAAMAFDRSYPPRLNSPWTFRGDNRDVYALARERERLIKAMHDPQKKNP